MISCTPATPAHHTCSALGSGATAAVLQGLLPAAVHFEVSRRKTDHLFHPRRVSNEWGTPSLPSLSDPVSPGSIAADTSRERALSSPPAPIRAAAGDFPRVDVAQPLVGHPPGGCGLDVSRFQSFPTRRGGWSRIFPATREGSWRVCLLC
jgi:hypothetical protein